MGITGVETTDSINRTQKLGRGKEWRKRVSRDNNRLGKQQSDHNKTKGTRKEDKAGFRRSTRN